MHDTVNVAIAGAPQVFRFRNEWLDLNEKEQLEALHKRYVRLCTIVK
jgi:hypothetical protein